MRSTSSRILKASDVKVEGTFILEISRDDSGSSKQSSTALVKPQVRVVESKPEFSVIEITCSCGEKLNLKCEHAAAKAPQNGQSKSPKKAK